MIGLRRWTSRPRIMWSDWAHWSSDSSDDWGTWKSWSKWPRGYQCSYDGNEDEGDAKDWREPQTTAKPEITQTENKGDYNPEA